ncbi:MAG: phage holin family protein [Firmicutes bacterium]|nr:phage holin family protein [Bacillota bacterium]
MEWLGHILRFIASAVVLMFLGFLLPGFSSLTFGQALIAAGVITALGYLVQALMGRNISAYSRGITGFLVSAVVIYAAQFLVPGLQVSIIGALLAAFVVGIIDLFVPTTVR